MASFEEDCESPLTRGSKFDGILEVRMFSEDYRLSSALVKVFLSLLKCRYFYEDSESLVLVWLKFSGFNPTVICFLYFETSRADA